MHAQCAYVWNIYIYIYIHTYIHTCIYTYTYIYIHIHTYTYIYIHTHTYTYTYIHTLHYITYHTIPYHTIPYHTLYIYVYVYMYTCIYILYDGLSELVFRRGASVPVSKTNSLRSAHIIPKGPCHIYIYIHICICIYVYMYTYIIYTHNYGHTWTPRTSDWSSCRWPAQLQHTSWPEARGFPGAASRSGWVVHPLKKWGLAIRLIYVIVGADDTGLCGRFSRGFLAHDMGFMHRFCYVFLNTWHGSFAPT